MFTYSQKNSISKYQQENTNWFFFHDLKVGFQSRLCSLFLIKCFSSSEFLPSFDLGIDIIINSIFIEMVLFYIVSNFFPPQVVDGENLQLNYKGKTNSHQ